MKKSKDGTQPKIRPENCNICAQWRSVRFGQLYNYIQTSPGKWRRVKMAHGQRIAQKIAISAHRGSGHWTIHSKQKMWNIFGSPDVFFNTTCGGLPQDTKMAHPGTSIWSVAPQNHVFHKWHNKRLSTFEQPDFLIFLPHFAKSFRNNQKPVLDNF